MNSKVAILKGTHPGRVIGYDIKKNHTSQNALAADTGVSKQMINAIIAGRRSLSVELALKIEKAMGYDEGFLAQLQTFFDIEKIKRDWSRSQHKTAPNIRRVVFWDTDFDKIDWNRYRSFVIQRVLTRGSEDERREISRFYGIPLDRLAEHSLKEIPYSPKP